MVARTIVDFGRLTQFMRCTNDVSTGGDWLITGAGGGGGSSLTSNDWWVDTGTGSSTQTTITWAPTVTTSRYLPPTQPVASPEDFNRYLIASDLMEEFIQFCGEQGLRQEEFMRLPIELFLNWLVIRAAESDEEDVPEGVVLQLPDPKRRCAACGRFIRRAHPVDVCNASCGARSVEKKLAA